MGSGAAPSSTPPANSPRPPAWYFIIIVALVLAGIAAPITVNWYEHRVASTVPVDTTGDTRDSLRTGAARDSAPRAHPDTVKSR